MNVKMKFYFVEGEEKKVNIISHHYIMNSVKLGWTFCWKLATIICLQNLLHAHLSRICTILRQLIMKFA
jgi:hypothetical protein